MRYNRPTIGFILGALMPVIGFFVVFAILREGDDLESFWNHMVSNHRHAALVITLSILANLLPFIYFTNKRLDYAAKGVFIATMLFAVAILLLRYVW